MLISQAYAQAGGSPGGGGIDITTLAPLVLIFVVFYFLLIRPQQKKMKEQRAKIDTIDRGDRVVTGGGIIGLVIKKIGDHEVQLEIAEGVRVRVLKTTITDILARNQPVRAARAEARDVVVEDDKPFIGVPDPDAAKAAAAVERPAGLAGMLGGLFGRKKS